MLHGSIRSKLFFYYLHSQCGLQTCSQFKWSWHIVNNTEFHVRIIFLRGKMWIFWEFPNVTWLFFHIEGEIFKTSKVTAHEWNLWSSVSQAPQTELYYSTRNVKPPLHLSSSLLSPPSFHLSRPKPLLSTLTPSTPTTSYIKMLQRSLKERRPPRQMQRRRPPSPRMLKAKV